MIGFKSKMDVSTPEEIFLEINNRFIGAIMMHGQFADYFDFLGLRGYKNLHEYQHLAESIERRKVCRYYINHHNALIKEDFSGEVNIIPDAWYTAKRLSVGKSTKQKAVEDGFLEYHNWESDTKFVYEKYAQKLRETGSVADAIFVEKLVEDVSAELKTVERMISDLISVGYDMVYITEIQPEIQEKYNKKLKGIEVE
ncbi:hypothetical protein [Coprococcus comes]|uniref:Uncharacterized protein n=1 Tax=Coprococcus comes TaxID=410072 RepID=A0A414QMM4_9FIRM|nr:hypothetical protein [Coprococcus comes]RHF82031.1 hypothetical protein DW656_12150 [Coprococcus comes]